MSGGEGGGVRVVWWVLCNSHVFVFSSAEREGVLEHICFVRFNAWSAVL